MFHFMSAILMLVSTNHEAIAPLSKLVAKRFLGRCYAKRIEVGMTHDDVIKLVGTEGFPKAGTNQTDLRVYFEYGFVIWYKRHQIGTLTVGKVSLLEPCTGEVTNIISRSRR